MSSKPRARRKLKSVCIEDLPEEEQAQIRRILDRHERSKSECAEADKPAPANCAEYPELGAPARRRHGQFRLP